MRQLDVVAETSHSHSLCVCVYVCMYVCIGMYVCMYVCMYRYICMYVCMYEPLEHHCIEAAPQHGFG